MSWYETDVKAPSIKMPDQAPGAVLGFGLSNIFSKEIERQRNNEASALAQENLDIERAMRQQEMDRAAEDNALYRAMKQQEMDANSDFRKQQLLLQEKLIDATTDNKKAYNETLLEMQKAKIDKENAKLSADSDKAAAKRDDWIRDEYAKLFATIKKGMFSGFFGTQDDLDAIKTLELLQAYGVDPNIARNALQKALIDGSGWLSDTTFTVDDLSKYMPPVDFDGKKISFGEAVKLDQEGKRTLVVDPVTGKLTIK